MKKRHTVEQIIRMLGEIENSGLKASDACRPHGITEQTYYRWRKKYGGMEVSEAVGMMPLSGHELALASIGHDSKIQTSATTSTSSYGGSWMIRLFPLILFMKAIEAGTSSIPSVVLKNLR